MLRVYLLLFVVAFSSASQAWHDCASSTVTNTPQSVCDSIYTAGGAAGLTTAGTFAFPDPHSMTFKCKSYKDGNDRNGSTCSNPTNCPTGTTLTPTGVCNQTCPAGQVNDATGACACPSGWNKNVTTGACEYVCTAGQDTFSFSKPTGTALSLGSPDQCISGCAVTLTAAKSIDSTGQNCGATLADPTITKCYFYGNRSGSSCSTSNSAAAPIGFGSPATTAATPTTATSQNTVTTTQPAYTAPIQTGTTVSVTTTASSVVNPDGSVTTTTTEVTRTINADGGGTTVTKTGTATSPGGNGKAEGTGAGTGTGTGSGGAGAGECDPTASDYEDCISGEQTGVEHTTGSAATFGEASANFWNDVKGTPIGSLAAGSGIGGTVSVGACPAPSIELFGHSFSMSGMCTIYDGVSSTLSAMMNVIYVAAGILIILSA